MTATKWDKRFLELAYGVSSWSKDESRKVGCVIVGPDKEVRSIGFNGPPRGVSDVLHNNRPEKYLYYEHSERNCAYNAARIGISLKDCTAYLPWYPCCDCTRCLIQVGISRVVCTQLPDFEDPQWGPGFKASETMFREAGIVVDIYPDIIPALIRKD